MVYSINIVLLNNFTLQNYDILSNRQKNMKNTAEVCRAAGGAKPPKSTPQFPIFFFLDLQAAACPHCSCAAFSCCRNPRCPILKLNEYDKAKRYDRFMAAHSGTDQPVNAEGLLHPIHIFNKNYYLYAREGDTFKSIGKEVGISWRKLARYNERDKHTILRKGDIIYLKKKRSKAPKQYKGRPHVIKPGESMYVISQKYGIRLEKLYKMNHLDPNIPVSIGTRLRVR